MRRFIFGLLFTFLAIIIGFVALNWGSLWQQFKFAIRKPNSVSVDKLISQEDKKTTPNQLRIPSLAISAPLVEAEQANEDSYQKALQNGVVHFPGTAKPGENGNAYYFGHSSDFAFAKGDYKTVFALLPKITEGAEIYISNQEGIEFKYLVVEKKVVNNNDVSVLDQRGNKEKLLSLQTSYPVGTALQRFVVVARLIE